MVRASTSTTLGGDGDRVVLSGRCRCGYASRMSNLEVVNLLILVVLSIFLVTITKGFNQVIAGLQSIDEQLRNQSK